MTKRSPFIWLRKQIALLKCELIFDHTYLYAIVYESTVTVFRFLIMGETWQFSVIFVLS